ncbi:hypothetical protein JCM31185_18940 [Furfurilactobacillus curtus]|uniref:Transposase n=1 Tax=Furfurilactobacillus curtus TaxID=1746200 RepID=A0ABQ5JU95_9LACO
MFLGNKRRRPWSISMIKQANWYYLSGIVKVVEQLRIDVFFDND